MYSRRNFNEIEYSKRPVEQKLKDCRTAIKSIRDTLKPSDPNFDQINLSYILEILKELNVYLALFDNVVNNDDPQNLKDVNYIQKHCKSASTVYKSINEAVRVLRVARDARLALERLPNRFDYDIDKAYYKGLDECQEALSEVLRHF